MTTVRAASNTLVFVLAEIERFCAREGVPWPYPFQITLDGDRLVLSVEHEGRVAALAVSAESVVVSNALAGTLATASPG